MSVDIIAELGINHNGSFGKALSMLLATKGTGVKIAKFQHYDALKLLGPDSPYLAYATQCQFTKKQHEELKAFCDSIGLEYLVSVFDIADIPWANSLCKRHKVASRMNKDNNFREALLMTGKEVIMSVQKDTYVGDLLWNSPQMRFMYCVTEYPTPEEHIDLRVCSLKIGLSSHCPSIKPTLKAVAQGATLIEHHVTFSREDEGCDHSSSITFSELRQLQLMANELEIIQPH